MFRFMPGLRFIPEVRLFAACVASVSEKVCQELKVALVPTFSTN